MADGSGNFFARLWDLVGDLGGTSGPLLVGLAVLVLIVVLKRAAPFLPVR